MTFYECTLVGSSSDVIADECRRPSNPEAMRGTLDSRFRANDT